MGLLIDGQWHEQRLDTKATGGRFVRSESTLRNWVTADGSPGPSGSGGFKAEPGRYHLYVSLACPWACRTLIMRVLKGLQDIVSVSVVNPVMGAQGWTFDAAPGVVADPVAGATHLYQVYLRADPRFSGRVTVPVLWDLARDTIVSNESAEIMRMLNRAFDGVGAHEGDYAPPELLAQIDALNDEVFDAINNGVYKVGFATVQLVYDAEVRKLFAALERFDARLSSQRWLLGDRLTEADWRLFTSLIRFDAVYHGHFKCNLGRLVDYPNLWRHTRELYHWPGIAETVDFDHIKQHYYRSHPSINPNGIVAAGPILDLAPVPLRAL